MEAGAHGRRCPRRLEEGVRSLELELQLVEGTEAEEGVRAAGTRVTDSCELPCEVREQDLVLWKSSQCSQLLSRLSSPLFIWQFCLFTCFCM